VVFLLGTITRGEFLSTQLSAGNTIETRCTRCNGVLNHTIVAMVGEKIVRVECSTCHGVHAFHPVKAPKVPKAPAAAKAGQKKIATPRTSKADPEAAARAEWEALQPEMDASQAIPYDMNRVYRVKNLLSHPNFGLGIVQLLIPPNKIDVLFQAGKKRLRCG
jgi:hypothetical protein